MKILKLGGVELKRRFMKTLLAAVGGMVLGVAGMAQADVLLLGGLEPVAAPAPVVYAQPVVYQAPPVFVQAPVYVQQPAPLFCAAQAPPCYGPASQFIYVPGPGSCQQDYCAPRRCDPNVIYFGRMQACREGYQFGHAR
jgi:hypothetical protein